MKINKKIIFTIMGSVISFASLGSALTAINTNNGNLIETNSNVLKTVSDEKNNNNATNGKSVLISKDRLINNTSDITTVNFDIDTVTQGSVYYLGMNWDGTPYPAVGFYLDGNWLRIITHKNGLSTKNNKLYINDPNDIGTTLTYAGVKKINTNGDIEIPLRTAINLERASSGVYKPSADSLPYSTNFTNEELFVYFGTTNNSTYPKAYGPMLPSVAASAYTSYANIILTRNGSTGGKLFASSIKTSAPTNIKSISVEENINISNMKPTEFVKSNIKLNINSSSVTKGIWNGLSVEMTPNDDQSTVAVAVKRKGSYKKTGNFSNSFDLFKENIIQNFVLTGFKTKDFADIAPKATKDLTIWEMNAIAAGNRDIKLLSRAFDNIDANNIKTITTVQVLNGIITLTDATGATKVSTATTKTDTILTKALSDTYFAVGGIWVGKTIFGEVYLKATTEISANAFENKNLTSVTIPNTVTIIGENAFKGNELTTISIPESVVSIGLGAFIQKSGSGFTDSKDITITPTLLNTNCSNGKTVKENFMEIFGVVYTGSSSDISAKKTNDLTIWEMNAIAAGNREIDVLSKAFNNVNSTTINTIQSVEVLNGIITLNIKEGFSITSVISTNVTTILIKRLVDEYFAAGGIWNNKENLTLDDLNGTTEISANAFTNRTLKSLFIPNSVTSIGNYAFDGNQLTSVTLGNKINHIGESSFRNNKINEIIIPDSVTSIGNGAFLNNQFSFENITISETILNSICSWNEATVKQNFKLIFGIDYLNSFSEIVAKETNDLTIWEMNAIVKGNRNVLLLSRAFDNIDANSAKSIKSANITNGIITLVSNGGLEVSSKPTTNTTTILTKELSQTYLLSENIWAGKTTFGEDDLNGTTKIENLAFAKSSLETLVIPNSVTSIGAHSFEGNKLKELIIPNSVTSIGIGAFASNQLFSIVFSDNINTISEECFANNALASLVIPNNIKTIEKNAFSNNRLTSLTLPNTLTNIGIKAFYINLLSTIVIPKSVVKIEYGSFDRNQFTSQNDITIEQNLLNSESGWQNQTVRETFYEIFGVRYTNSFKDITPKETNDLTIWEMNAIFTGSNDIKLLSRIFYGIDNDSIKTITSRELGSKTVILKTTDGSFVESIPSTNTETVLTKELTKIYFATGGIWANKNNFTEVDLRGTTEIGYKAFDTKALIQSMEIPNSVTKIGAEAFLNCYNLQSIKLPNTITTIERATFQGAALTSIIIPDSVTSIGENAFGWNKLTSVIIPNNVTIINNGAFRNNLFKNHKDITISRKLLNTVCSWNNKRVKDNFMEIFSVNYIYSFIDIVAKATNDLSIWEMNAINNGYKSVSLLSKAFDDLNEDNIKTITSAKENNGVITLKDASNSIDSIKSTNTTTILTKTLVDNYMNNIWSGKRDFIVSDLIRTTEISESAFASKRLNSIIIPNTVMDIKSKAFQKTGLNSATFENGIKNISDFAFEGNNLTNVIIPDSVVNIGASSFANNKLNKLIISKNATDIGDSAFQNNKLTSISIPTKVKNIGKFAFQNNQIELLTFGDNSELVVIGDNSFQKNKIEWFTLPNAVTTIGTYAFDSNQLGSPDPKNPKYKFTIPKSVTKIGIGAFTNNTTEFCEQVIIETSLMDSVCNYWSPDLVDEEGKKLNEKTLAQNYELIFGVPNQLQKYDLALILVIVCSSIGALSLLLIIILTIILARKKYNK